MSWAEARTQFPHSWVVLEAFGAYTEGHQRIVPKLTVLDTYGDDFSAAWARYKTLKSLNRAGEYYVVHTDRLLLDIGVLTAFGRGFMSKHENYINPPK